MINNPEGGFLESGNFNSSAVDRRLAPASRETRGLEQVIEYIRYFLVEEGVFEGEDGSHVELEKRLENDGLFVKDMISLVGELRLAQIQQVLMRAGCPDPAYFAQKIVGLKNEFEDVKRGVMGSGGITYRPPGEMGQPLENGQ